MVRTIEFYCAILALATAVVSAPVGYQVSTLTPKQPAYSEDGSSGGSTQPLASNQIIPDIEANDEPMSSPEDGISTEDPTSNEPSAGLTDEASDPVSTEGSDSELPLLGGEYKELSELPETTEEPTEEDIIPESPAPQTAEGSDPKTSLGEENNNENLEKMPEITEDSVAGRGSGSVDKPKRNSNVYATDDLPSEEPLPSGETIIPPNGPGNADPNSEAESTSGTPTYEDGEGNPSELPSEEKLNDSPENGEPEEELVGSPSAPGSVEPEGNPIESDSKPSNDDPGNNEIYDPEVEETPIEETVTETTETTKTTDLGLDDDNPDEGADPNGSNDANEKDNVYEQEEDSENDEDEPNDEDNTIEDDQNEDDEDIDEQEDSDSKTYESIPKKIQCSKLDESDTSGAKMGASGNIRLGGVDLMNLNLGGRLFGKNGLAEVRGGAGLLGGNLINAGTGGTIFGNNILDECMEGSLMGGKGNELLKVKKSMHALGDDGLVGAKVDGGIIGDAIAAGADVNTLGDGGLASTGGRVKLADMDNKARVGVLTDGRIVDASGDLMQKYVSDEDEEDEEDEGNRASFLGIL